MSERRGFTLIELLVVIAIIALLMGILMPALSRVRQQARAVACQSNIRQWGTIWAMYTDDNNGMFPIRTRTSGRWIDVLFDYYYKDDDFRVCPVTKKIAAPDMATDTLTLGGDAKTSWGIVGPSGGRPVGTWGSYGINGWVYVCGESSELYGKPKQFFWKTPNTKGAAQVPLFMDCWFWGGWPDDTDSAPVADDRSARLTGDTDSMGRFCINRHEGAINGVFMDFSVRKIWLKELWGLKWSKRFNTHVQVDWPDWMVGLKGG